MNPFSHVLLTPNQLACMLRFLQGQKHWSEKKKEVLCTLRSFQIKIEEEELEYFMDVFLAEEYKRHQKLKEQNLRERIKQSRRGEISTESIPCQSGKSHKVPKPVIGQLYQLEWASRGCCFVLKRLDPDGIHCYVDNPVHKRTELLKCKRADLRPSRKNERKRYANYLSKRKK